MNLAIETAKSIFLIVSTLFPIVNPLGGSPIFLSLTRAYPQEARWTLSRAIAVNSLFLLIGSYLIGTHILSFFGISLPVVQVGGGIVVISTGWTMLKHRDEDERVEVHRNVTQEDLARRDLEADGLNWLVPNIPPRFGCFAKIRYRHKVVGASW